MNIEHLEDVDFLVYMEREYGALYLKSELVTMEEMSTIRTTYFGRKNYLFENPIAILTFNNNRYYVLENYLYCLKRFGYTDVQWQYAREELRL